VSPRTEKHDLLATVLLWAIALVAAIAAVSYVHRRSDAILDFLVQDDPAPNRRALRSRLEADKLVHEAFLRHEIATSGTAAAGVATGTLMLDAIPLLERAEKLYLDSLEAVTSQPAVLFQLGEVSFLQGKRARAYLYMARYWEAIGERTLARAYRRFASDIDPSATIPLRSDATTSSPAH